MFQAYKPYKNQGLNGIIYKVFKMMTDIIYIK